MLDQRFARFRGVVHKQSSGALMGTAPAPDLVNGCAIMHELDFFFFFYPPADGEKYSFSSPHFHVFSYASCVDFTQLLSQPNASWRTLRVPL